MRKHTLPIITAVLLLFTSLWGFGLNSKADPKATIYSVWSETSPYFGWVYGYDSEGHPKVAEIVAAVYIKGADDTHFFCKSGNLRLPGIEYFKIESSCYHELYDATLVMIDDSCGVAAFTVDSIGNGELDILRAESAFDAEYLHGYCYNIQSGEIMPNETLFAGDLRENVNGNYEIEYLYSDETGIQGPTILLNDGGKAVGMIGDKGRALGFASTTQAFYASERESMNDTQWSFSSCGLDGPAPTEAATTEAVTTTEKPTTEKATTEQTTTEETTTEQPTTETVTTEDKTNEETTEPSPVQNNTDNRSDNEKSGMNIGIMILCILLGAAFAVIIMLIILLKKKDK